MLINIKATYKCDSCEKEEDWIMGNPMVGCYFQRNDILSYLEQSILPGWIKDSNGSHFCHSCHMSKPLLRPRGQK